MMFRKLTLALAFALAGCSQMSEVVDDIGLEGKSETFFLPGRNIGSAPRDIQLYIELEKEYLRSDHTWPYENPVGAINFNLDLKSMEALPKSGAYSYHDYDEFLRVSLRVVEADYILKKTDPAHHDYSPVMYIGDKPVLGQIFGLDVRQNRWLNRENRPDSELYTYSENGEPIVMILCKANLFGAPSPRSCEMEFFVDGLVGTDLSVDFGARATVAMRYEQLSEWRNIWRTMNDFIQERSRIVPYQERTAWSLKDA